MVGSGFHSVECCTISQNIHWPGLEISETARVKLEFLYLNAPLGQLLEPILKLKAIEFNTLEVIQSTNPPPDLK